jgi:hypothetical protein
VSKGKKMTRQEHVDRAVVGLPMGSDFGISVNKAQYEAYRELGYGGSELPTWEEAVTSLNPWLRSDEAYEEATRPRPPLTDEDRARIQAERDKYPTLRSTRRVAARPATGEGK